jgi:hypothetical protein
MFRKPTIQVLGLTVTITFAVFGSAAQGEIAKRSGTSSEREAPTVSAARLAPEPPLKVECWQYGKKIIAEDGLYGFTMNSLLEGESISFRRAPRGNADVIVVSTAHSTCLIRHSTRNKFDAEGE